MQNGAPTERCGMVVIIGRPNVGKSTFLNHTLGQKISITSRKPQTTRHQILGIKNLDHAQIVYVDTPGIIQQQRRALERYLSREALRALADVDVIVFMVEALQWTDADEFVLERIRTVTTPVILAINKVDKVPEKSLLLPFIEMVSQKLPFREVVPLSGQAGTNVQALERCLVEYLPVGPHLFADDQVTDRSERFFAAELIREKLLRKLSQEVPHRLSVTIDEFADKKGLLHISATIWVEREGQKRIVIGRQGSVLKVVGERARLDMEQMFGRKVFLRTWVKVKEQWSDDERAMREFGLEF